MARVTVTFEDVDGGAQDGAAQMRFECDPPVTMRDGRPVAELTLAQRQAFFAIEAVQVTYDLLDCGLDIREVPDAF